MIEYKKGNILNSKCDVLVNPVNCMGVMGAGLARQFANRYPEYYQNYSKACHRGDVVAGKTWWYAAKDHWICSFTTKEHWRFPSELQWISDGLYDLGKSCQYDWSIAFPKLGCGLGGLEWADVKPLIEKHFGDWTARVEVYV